MDIMRKQTLLLALTLSSLPALAWADGEPRVELTGARPLVVAGKGGTARFHVVNTGSAPLEVTEVRVRGDDQMPAARGLSVAPAALPVTLEPGAKHEVVVVWRPEGPRRAKQVFGHVEVVSSDPHHRLVAMGVTSTSGNFLQDHLLTTITFVPLVGVLAIFLLFVTGRGTDRLARIIGYVTTAIPFALSIWLVVAFDGAFGRADGNGGMQFIEHAVWIRGFNIEYFLGVDGLSVAMVLLTALVSFVGVIVSESVTRQVQGYFAMYLLLVTGMFGVFVSLDFFLFYVFWEVMLLPMYFLIGIWGGPRKEYAAIKFFLYTLAGSVLMLIALILLYYHAEPAYLVDGSRASHPFNMLEMMRQQYDESTLVVLGLPMHKLCWVFLFIGFAIKVPMFPFHTWLPDAHVEAPTAISVILAGVLLKMGTYGMMRINFAILPDASQWAAAAVAVFGLINIIYGAFCAMAQEDLKKLVAYSSVSHMGFCLLGLGAMTPQGFNGAMLQMFNHGTITAMLFTLVGVVYDRAHTREIGKFGGLASEMPLYTAFVGLAFMASLGLPGLSGFIGEALVFLGSLSAFPVLTTIAITGVVVTAAYHLWALQRVFLGKFNESWRTSHALEATGGKFPEMNRRELFSLLPMAVIVVVLGFYPMPMLDLVGTGLEDLRQMVLGADASVLAQAGAQGVAALAGAP